MPKSLGQEILFTIMMVFVMVYAMICYNIALVTIETSKSVDENLIKAAVTDAGYEYAGIIA